MRFRKRPVEIEARQWTGNNLDELTTFTYGYFEPEEDGDYTGRVYDHLHDSWINVSTGDWIVRGNKGEHYPVRADVFAETYEPVDGA